MAERTVGAVKNSPTLVGLRTLFLCTQVLLFSAASAGETAEPPKAVPLEPKLAVEVADNGVSVDAEYVSIVHLIDAIAAKTATKIEVAPGVWGLVKYNSKGSRPLEEVLKEVAKRYELVFTPVEKDGQVISYSAAPQDPATYFLTDEDFFRPYVREIHYETPKEGTNSGWFFLDGHLIPPPYAIAVRQIDRDNAEVTLNGIVLDRVRNPDPEPIVDPGEVTAPAGCQSLYCGMDLPRLLLRKYAFWLAQHGKERAIQMLSELLAKLPPVARFEFGEGSSHVMVYSKSGEREMLMLTDTRAPRMTAGEFAQQIRASAAVYESLLKSGCTLLRFTGGAEVAPGRDRAGAFRDLLDFLSSSGFDRRFKVDLLGQLVKSMSFKERIVLLANRARDQGN